MNIGIWNLEPQFRNFALDKVEIYHQLRGDSVERNMFIGQHDKVYCSAIFDWTPNSQKYLGLPYHLIQTGGTGFNTSLTLPHEIEVIEPHHNYGYTTRGCIRNCPFCIVRQKEGYIKAVGDIVSLWDGKAGMITLLDNNALALPGHFALNCKQARKFNLKLDWNQGLDHRLLTPETIDIIQSVRHCELRFAFDHPSYVSTVSNAIDLLQAKGIKRCNWYVLVGFDTTLEQDLFRLNYLRDRNQIAYIQRYRSKNIPPKVARNKQELTALARWTNQHHIFRGVTWEQFLRHPQNRRYKHLLNPDYAEGETNKECEDTNGR